MAPKKHTCSPSFIAYAIGVVGTQIGTLTWLGLMVVKGPLAVFSKTGLLIAAAVFISGFLASFQPDE
ncbi:hypothetical protein FHS61_002954 [Altererythrobacter atlanticus]|uniref:Uncharacterized protein n=1 Tax=Croceibacterium atlanticum TaxID=1267766 RepID=A0A0F7KYT0_9SPHN|nr:hypothetical protein [Croceibacterium atlanticum]AKH44310.1 hypothetical protein WYH_03291 [Croceibacterium atlanticum]MBB5733907.1 hypothetical protein [Croceibacterium atlanticum]